jgi:vancomycin resistance protein YoaR
MTTATEPRRLAPRYAIRVSARAATLAFLATLFVAVLAGAAVAAYLMLTYQDRVLPAVHVAGVDLSGLDRESAAARLERELSPVAAGTVALRIGEDELTVSLAALGRAYDTDAMVEAAMTSGRGGTVIERAVRHLVAPWRPIDLPAQVRDYDPVIVEQTAATIAAGYERPAANASVRVAAGGIGFEAVPGSEGRHVEPGEVRDALVLAIAGASGPVELTPLVVPPAITTAEAEAAARRANAIGATDLMLTAGEERRTIAAATIRSATRVAVTVDALTTSVDPAPLRAALTALAAEIDRDPVDAGFIVEFGLFTGVTPSVEGRQLLVDESLEAVLAALRARADGEGTAEVPLALSVTQPALTTEAAAAAVPLTELVSSWTTHFEPGEHNYWGANITVPALAIDGTVVPPGGWFEFWSAVGPVTADRGYGPGGAIIGGKSDPTGAWAGGICSTSTTLFNAALRAGLDMGIRAEHFYYISRYPVGLDATVWQSGGVAQTMTFRNDTPYPLLIRGSGGPDWVQFDIYGVPTGRTVAFSEPTITNHRPASDLTEETDDLPPGDAKRIETPHDGMDVFVTRTVHDPDGTVRHYDEYFSRYGVVHGRTLVGAGTATGEAEAAAAP